MKISDYGRNVVKLIEYAKSIEDREKRTKVAEAIVEVMAIVNPQVRTTADYKRKLWDHLMIMANFELDVDTPYEVVRPDDVQLHPVPLKYKSGDMRYRHYGRTMEKMVTQVAAMEEGEERRVLTEQIAHAMKRSYLTWNRDTVDDTLVIEQMEEMSENKLHPYPEFQFHKEYSIEKAETQAKNKKKKKKK